MTCPDEEGNRLPGNAVNALMLEFARGVGADGITLWKAADTHLRAVSNPLEPGMIGRRQPLDRGLVSQVYLTGQSILEQQLKSHPHHDPSIDEQQGTRGVAMMAAPVETADAGDEGGVISAVIFEGHEGPIDFSLASLGRLASLARQLARMIRTL